jgi:chromosome segregation ATPase
METEDLIDRIEELENRCEHLETDRNNLALRVEELQTKLRMMSELYQICSSTTNKLLTQRNEARKEVCLLRNNENPEEYAALRSWDFHTITDSDAHLAAANNIVASTSFKNFMEEFEVLMGVAETTDTEIADLAQSTWENLSNSYRTWIQLGGKHEAA